MNGGVEVARDGQVDEEERAATAGAERPVDTLLLQHESTGARRGDDHVGLRQLVLGLVEGDGPRAEASRKLLRAGDAAIRDRRDGGAARHEVARRLLADLSRADDEDLPAGKIAEHLLSERGRGG